MIRLTDICSGECVEVVGYYLCECGLPWDATRGRHTRGGVRITEDVYCRILAREGNAIDVEERREADREAIRARRRMTIGGGR